MYVLLHFGAFQIHNACYSVRLKVTFVNLTFPKSIYFGLTSSTSSVLAKFSVGGLQCRKL